jgi:hypothetical protein
VPWPSIEGVDVICASCTEEKPDPGRIGFGDPGAPCEAGSGARFVGLGVAGCDEMPFATPESRQASVSLE